MNNEVRIPVPGAQNSCSRRSEFLFQALRIPVPGAQNPRGSAEFQRHRHQRHRQQRIPEAQAAENPRGTGSRESQRHRQQRIPEAAQNPS
jgi:hypothetical protein